MLASASVPCSVTPAVIRSAAGTAVLVAGYLLTLTVFASVQWLQYWDYARP